MDLLLYVAIQKVFVVLFTRVLHDFPVGPQSEDSRILPGLGKCFRIIQRDLVADVFVIRSGEALDSVQRIAMRVSDRIEIGFVIKPDRFDDQRIAVPFACVAAGP